MPKYLRNALATFCFAASVACLALWWRKCRTFDSLYVYMPSLYANFFYAISKEGGAKVTLYPGGDRKRPWRLDSRERGIYDTAPDNSQFGAMRRSWIYFPHWYAALVLALAGIASLRLGRRFTLRSAIIATTVVAMLLGMAVIL